MLLVLTNVIFSEKLTEFESRRLIQIFDITIFKYLKQFAVLKYYCTGISK